MAPSRTFRDLHRGAWLEENKPSLANQLKGLAWIADRVDNSEREAAEQLIAAAIWYPEVFDSLMQKPWLLDSVTAHETTAIHGIRWMAREDTEMAERTLAKSWVQDDITRDEASVIDRFRATIRAEDESLQQQVIQKAIEILDMPFLDTVESPDALAVSSLERFEDAGSAEFLELMTHPTLSDGIDDEEAKIVVLLGSINRFKPQLVPVLLDGTSVFKEERTINLPHSGEVLLAIIRLHDHTNPNMYYLEHAVRHHEGFMGEALPTNYVAWHFVDYGGAGRHVGTHIESNPARDPAVAEYWRAPRHAAHEVGHYYWRDSQKWISEGGADMLVILSENERVGRPLVHNRDQCTIFNTIGELETAAVDKDDDGFSCTYRLGQRLFLDLYRGLGEDAFQQGFRRLYLKRLRDDPFDDCEGNRLDLCHVEAAFKTGVSNEVAAQVDEVIGHWYYGRTGTHEGDRVELVALYYEMGGPNWTDSTNWLSDAHIGEWYGVATDGDGRVIELNLAENGLSGQIPSELFSLTNLRELLLSDNRLSGQIPPELGGLTNLTRLEFDDNRLTGAIPFSLGNLTNLTRLEFDDNRLTGAIPSSLGNLTNLTRLVLDDNRLTGAMPDWLSNLAALRYVRLAGDNRFSGCVPVGLNDVADNDLDDLGLPYC